MADLLTPDDLDSIDAVLDEGLVVQADTLALLVATARAYHAKMGDPIAAREQGSAALEQAAIMVAAHYEQLKARNLPDQLVHDLVADVHHVLITGAPGGVS